MKNQLRETRERNSKVIKEKTSQVLDLEKEVSRLRNNLNEVKLLEPLKQENDNLKREVQQITAQFTDTKAILEHRIEELLTELDAGTFQFIFFSNAFIYHLKTFIVFPLNQYSEEVVHVFIVINI